MENVIGADMNETYSPIPSGTIAMPYQGSEISLRDSNHPLAEHKLDHSIDTSSKGKVENTLVGRIVQLMRNFSMFFKSQEKKSVLLR